MSAAGFTAAAGRDQFLKLFVSQLQNQNPLDPTKQEDFLQQLAQFSTLEGIENMNDNLTELVKSQKQQSALTTLQTFNSGAGLIGKTVTHGTGEETDSGVVSEVRQTTGQVLLKIGETLVPVSQIVSVVNSPAI